MTKAGNVDKIKYIVSILLYEVIALYKTIIVEDDLMVCSILKKQLGRFPHLGVVDNFRRAEDALRYLEHDPQGADLIVLDYYMPEMTGVEFLHELRKTNCEVQVIMITSAGDYEIIRAAVCCGVCDYILKPFNTARLEKAIHKFETVMKLSRDTKVWTQEKVDMLLSPNRHYSSELYSAQLSSDRAAKINPVTLRNIKAYLAEHKGQPMPLADISADIELSTVTVRRYLKYLNKLGEIEITLDCKTGGRPSEIFEYKGENKNGQV